MPSFSIEVPGEANPLTEHQVVQTLNSAASSDPNQIQTGTKQLQEWQKSSGFYKHLQSAYSEDRLPFEIRYLAIIQLKNGINNIWWKHGSTAVERDEKDDIRSRLIQSVLHEQHNRLAVQNALTIAKIARFDYPKNWLQALSAWTDIIRNQSPPFQQLRALLVLLHVVKELSTGRLPSTRQNLQAGTPEIVHVLGTLYATNVEVWLSTPTENTEILMQQSLLAMKILRRLLITGYKHPNRDSEVLTLWRLTQEHLGSFIQLGKVGHPIFSLVEKHMVQLAKLHYDMASDHPAAFALLPNSIDLVRAYWTLAKDFGESFGSKEAVTSAVASARIGTDGDVDGGMAGTEKLVLKGLLIVRACLKMVHNATQTFKDRKPEDKEEKVRANELLRQDLLIPEFVRDVMETLVIKFFVFRSSDLREWEEEPEEWEKREEGGGEDWEFSVRSCSEKLFVQLANAYRDVLVQPLLQVFYSVASPENDNVLFKDSVYTAIGLAAAVLHEHLDFDAFIRDGLVAEVQRPTPGFNIVRRRVALLLGQWISIKVSEQSRPLVYQIFQHLLDKDDPLNDQVVRVTAGRQLKNICDDWEFKAEQFMPYAKTTLTRLMHLIEEVDLTETKMALLNTISVAVERLDHDISQFAAQILSMLPPLWESSNDEPLMKQAILTILARLVNAMKAESLPMHSMVFPIIRGAVEPGSETQVYLLDDAMDLWAAILVQTPEPASAELLAMVPHLYPIYELGSENLRRALDITESYVLLAPSHMLSEEVRLPVFSALASLLGKLSREANGSLCNLVELFVRAAEKLGGESAVSQMTADLVQVGFMSKLLRGLRGGWITHCTVKPPKEISSIDGAEETDYFAVLARIILGSLSGFCQACQSVAPPTDEPDTSLEATMKWLLEEWFLHIEDVGDPSREKLMCLALTKLLETHQPSILLSLQSLMTVWTDIITELREDTEDAGGDSLIYSNRDSWNPNGSGPEAPEDGRRRDCTFSDVVHTVSLPRFVKKYLEQAIVASGGMQTFEQEWLGNVDQDVVKAFLKLGIM